MSKALVIPTNRPDSLAKFFQAWKGKGGWDKVYVIYDAPEWDYDIARACNAYELTGGMDSRGITVYSHAEIKRELGDNAWIISQEDSACRCFGFLKAWQNRDEWVLTLDDDCLPYEPHCNLMDRHIAAMTQQPVWESSILGMRVRGLPYTNSGKSLQNINYGLWTHYADFDAATELTVEKGNGNFFPPVSGTRVLPYGSLAPLSGMNLCANRAALPLLYFPLQGKGQPYRRFDDIWAGVIAKTLCDRIGWRIGVGEPFIEHHRASDVRANLEKERPGTEANEIFWEKIALASYRVPFTPGDAIYAVQKLGGELEDSGWNYIAKLGKALKVWANLFCRNTENRSKEPSFAEYAKEKGITGVTT